MSPSDTGAEMLAIMDPYAMLVEAADGDYFVGYCPACRVGPPRMIVRPKLANWHCFHCGAGGDLIEFLSIAEHIDRAQAEILLHQLRAEPVVPEPVQLQEAPIHTADPADTRFEPTLQRLAAIKGCEGAALFVGGRELVFGNTLGDVSYLLQVLATILESGRQLLNEPSGSNGVVILRNEKGKLMLVEGEIHNEGYSVLLVLNSDVSEALLQLSVSASLAHLE